MAGMRALPCEDCGQEQAAGLCEVCGYRRRTEALTVEAGTVATAWSADLDDSQAVAAVLVHVRETLRWRPVRRWTTSYVATGGSRSDRAVRSARC